MLTDVSNSKRLVQYGIGSLNTDVLISIMGTENIQRDVILFLVIFIIVFVDLLGLDDLLAQFLRSLLHLLVQLDLL